MKFLILLCILFTPLANAKLQGKRPQWKEIYQAPPAIRENGNKVALLLIRKWDAKKKRYKRFNNGNFKIKRCTGFLIAPQTIMTNYHCINHPKLAWGVTAYFNHVEGVPSRKRMRIRCNKFVAHNKDLDYAVIKCFPKRYYRMNNPVVIDARPFNVMNGYDGKDRKLERKKDRQMYIIHQQCVGRGCTPFKKFQIDRIRETGAKDAKHEADTLAGTSGAPVFDLESNRLIALHHEGNPALNQAIPMYKIIKRFKYLSKKDKAYKSLLEAMNYLEK